eukprot:gene8464-11444_t
MSEDYSSDYENKLFSVWETLKRDLEINGPNQHTFLIEFILHGTINQSFVHRATERIDHHVGESDYDVISLIRFLYIADKKNIPLKSITNDSLESWDSLESATIDNKIQLPTPEISQTIQKINNSLGYFPFWPTDYHFQSADNIVF